MKQKNWLKLHRKIIDSSCFKDNNHAVLKVWIYCLTTAKHKKGTVLRGGTEVVMYPGQFIYSRPSWAKNLKLSASTLRNILKKLEKWDMIQDSYKDSGIATIYQIKNWKEYQSEDSFEDSFEDSRRTAGGQPEDTYKNDKNVKNDKELNKTKSKDLVPFGNGYSKWLEEWELAMGFKITKSLKENENALKKCIANSSAQDVHEALAYLSWMKRTKKIRERPHWFQYVTGFVKIHQFWDHIQAGRSDEAFQIVKEENEYANFFNR